MLILWRGIFNTHRYLRVGELLSSFPVVLLLFPLVPLVGDLDDADDVDAPLVAPEGEGDEGAGAEAGDVIARRVEARVLMC